MNSDFGKDYFRLFCSFSEICIGRFGIYSLFKYIIEQVLLDEKLFNQKALRQWKIVQLFSFVLTSKIVAYGKKDNSL